MDTENAYSWLYFWVGAKHHSFEGCPVNTSDEIRQQMNSVTKEIMQNAITTDDSTITGVSTMLDAVNEDNIEIMNVETAEPQERIASLDEDGAVGTTAPGPNVSEVEIQDEFSNTEG